MFPAALFVMLVLAWSGPACALDCADADPAGVTASVYGDFELTVDPDDPAQHMIFVDHVENGPSSIVVARMDGSTGQMEPGTLTTIADNFNGNKAINGPEFVMPPLSGLGTLYRNTDGVHGVFRPVGSKIWNDFRLTIDAQAATASPPTLPSTYRQSYDYGGLPLGQNTYTLFQGPCTQRCFANMRGGVPTDAAAVFARMRLYTPASESLVQGSRDDDILAELCSRANATNATCGVYAATIDGVGGFLAPPLLLTVLPPFIGGLPRRIPLAVGPHPETKANIVFTVASHESGQAIDVYVQKDDTSPLTLVGSVPASGVDHFRVVDNGAILVLHYLVRQGNLAGSYVLSVSYVSGQYRIGGPNRISTVSDGAEVEYLPAARHFGIFTRTSLRPSRIQRCFFDAP